MKRISIIALMVATLLFPAPLFATFSDSMEKSLEYSASAAVVTGSGKFHGIIIITDGTYNVTLEIRDNTSADGPKLIPNMTITTSSKYLKEAISLSPPVEFHTGIYVKVTCSGTVGYMIYYEKD